jgi:hypothetical protein
MRDSMVIYRCFFDSIEKLESQYGPETALKLLKAIVNYGIDKQIDEDMDPLIDLIFTNIKPLIQDIDKQNKRPF